MKKYLRLFVAAIKGESYDYTEGSLKKAIILLSIPMILEMMMESLFAVVDIYFVGKVSVNAVATVGLTESVMNIVYSLAVGLSMAVTSLVARRIGEKNREGASDIVVQAILLAVVVSLAIGVIGLFYSEDILRLMGGNDQLVQEGKTYTQIMLMSNIVIILLFLNNAVFRGAGNAAHAMRILWISNGLNIILDPLLILGVGPFPELGLTGAAVATTIGRGVGVMAQFYLLFKGSTAVVIVKRSMKYMASLMKQIVQISLGGIGQFLIATMSWLFLIRIIASDGSAAIAGYTIAIRIFIFTLLPGWGMANAAATLVGQNLGAQKPDRAEKAAWQTSHFAAVLFFFCAVLLFMFARPLALFFTQESEVLEYAVVCLKVISLGYVIYAYAMVISQSFNGAADTRTPTILNFIAFWLVQIPLAYILGVHLNLGPKGVIWAIVVAESVLAILAIALFRRGKWKSIKV